MDDVKVENVPYNVIPVTEYDPFEAKFSASLFWLVFRATEDGEFDNIPSQVTSPIQRDSEKRITVRPEVTEFLTNGEIYCKVCDSIFHGKVPVVGQWAIIQTLSRHGFYVVEEGDIAVTESALQQKKPFRKSTHLALMDCLMSAFSARAVTVQQVVQSVSKFSSFNASKELPFDMEDALLLWMNKLCAALNDNQLKKQKQHAEQLLQNQDKAKRFRFRRDQLQPKVQTAFPLMEELLKDISDGKSLLGIILFYHPTVINLEDVRFDTNLSTEDYVHNLDLFRSLCSQFICTSVLALKVEDLLYGSQAMKPNIIALLAEIFHKCEMESLTSENGVIERQTSKSDVDLRYIVANKENVVDNKSSSAPVLNSDKTNSIERGSPRESFQSKSERSSLMYGPLSSSALESVRQENTNSAWKSQSDSQVNSNSRLSFKSPFHLDFTVDYDAQQPPLNGPLPKQGVDKEKLTEKENPFSGIFQRPVLAGEARKHSLPINMPGGYGSPRTTPRQDVPLLMRRNKQKQRTLDLEEWDMQQEEVEDKSILQRYLQELHINDLQRSQSLTGLDKAKVEPRQSFHAWREDTGASLSDTNLSSSRNERISLDFRSNLTSSVPQRDTEGGIPQRGTQGIHVPMMLSGSKAKREEHTSQDSLSSSPKSKDSLNMRPTGDKPRERQHSLLSGVRDSCTSDMSAKELNQFEEIEAMILAGRSVETPRRFIKPSKLGTSVPDEEEDLNTSVSSEDMNKFRLEVLQRLTEDKLREIPDVAEMEDDDDPIRLARNNAAVSSPRNPPEQCTRLEVPDLPTEIPTDQLSPITETTEPCPSVASNPNSVSSANSTAPSSPCSPLDVAPFMPAFFTTSPANTLDRKKQRLSMKDREDTTERTLVAEEEDDDFPSDPETSATPRFQAMSAEKSREFPSRSKSFEQLTRGSYTVDHVSAESAKAAGIPVINASSEEIRGRADSANSQSSYLDSSDVFHSRKLSQKETNSSRDLSGFRPLVLSSAGGESNEAFPAEGVDGRRDSLESSPAHSPASTRGKRDDTRQEAAFRSRDMTAQDSPGDVVIFERSLSSSHGTKENTTSEDFISQTNENAQRHSTTVTRPKKTEAYVFDFNQDVVQHYESDPVPHDFRTYKKEKKPGGLADGSNLSQGECSGEQGTQQDGHCTHEHSHPNQHQTSAVKEFTSRDETSPRHVYEEDPGAGVNVKDLRESDGLSTFRENTVAEKNEGNVIPETSVKGLDLRRSDGFSTFRKEPTAGVSESLLAQFKTASVHGQRQHEADPFSTFAKSAKKHDGSQHRVQEGMHHSLELEPSAGVSESLLAQFKTASVHGHREHEADPFSTFAKSAKKRDGSLHRAQEGMHPPLELEPTAAVATRPLPSRGGEGEIHTTPRGGEEEEIRVSVSSNITRSRTFRKKPDGQIIHGDNIGASSSPGFDEERSSINNASKLTGQQTVNTHIRDSPEEAGGDNPHRISWTDESEAGARLMRQFNATVDRSTTQESHDTGGSPRRRGSPRQTGRGSPGARISWVTAAKSGVGGQVMLNDKGCMQEDTRTKFVADGLSNERPRFIATAVIRRKHLLHAEGAPWRTNENGAKVPEVLGLRTLTRVGPEEQAPVVDSGSLLKAPDTSSTLVNESRSSKEKFEKENNMLSASASEAEPDTRAGGSIRDRIRALTAAAGVSRLGVAQGREQSKKTLTKAATLSSEDETSGRIKPGLSSKASKSSENPAKTASPQELSQISKNGVAFDVGFQDAPKTRPRVLSRFRTSDLERKDEVVVSDNQVVSSKEIGVTKDTSVAFEVSFEDEPRSKRAKDERVLLQSPFKALKTRSNLRRQQKSNAKVCQPLSSTSKIGEIISMASSQEDYSKPARNSCTRGEVDENFANRDFTKGSESKTAQKQFKFSFVSESRITEKGTSEELSVDTASDDLATKQNDLKDKSSFEVPKLLKRNTFTLNSASDQGSPIVKAFNELATKQETVLPPSEHIPKRSTFTFESVSQSIESASGEGLPVANVLNDLANKEEFKQSKLQSDVDTSAPSSEKTQKRSTFTLENISKELDSAIEQGGLVSDVLQRTVASEKSQKRNTFTLENVSKELDSAIEQGEIVTDVLQGVVASEKQKSPNKPVAVDTLTKKDLTSEEKHEASAEKRSTYSLDTVSSSLQSGAKEGLPVTEVLCQLAKREELQSSGMSGTEESPSQIEPVQKRDAFTLDTVSQTSKDAQSKSLPAEEQIVSVQKRDTFTPDTVSQTLEDAQSKGLPAEESATQIEPVQKRDTFTLDTVSQTSKDAQSKGLPAEESPTQFESVQKRDTFTLDTVSQTSKDARSKGLSAEESTTQIESVQKRDTFSLDTVSQTLQDAQSKGLPAEESPTQIESIQKRDTFTLDTVSQTLQDAQSKGLPAVDVLDQLASKHESHLPADTPSEDKFNTKPSQKRDTYTLDTVSHAIEEAVEKGIQVSETLNHLAQEEKPLPGSCPPPAAILKAEMDQGTKLPSQHTPARGYDDSSAGEVACGLTRALSPDHRDEIEASFEDALEQLEDSLTLVSFPSASDREQSSADRERSSANRKRWSADRKQSSSDRERSSPVREQSSANREQSSSETPGNRGTYNLDDVSNSVEDGAQDGVPVADTLERLSRTKTHPKDGVEDSKLSEQRRGTYTLDEVSISLQTASEQGIPVVEALRNMTRAKETVRGTGESAQKRGTYTLNDVSKSLERAKKTGIPVIEALESLSQETPPSPLRLKIPERTTYTLDEVSLSLEKAQQKGLPVVDALGKLTASKDISLRQTPDAVHRRQKKLVNRKTYALASPLETIGEGAKLRLYDGSQRQMLSPLTLHMKTKEATPASKVNSSESKARGLGVVQKLDFLTSACELLLEANAKEMAKDRQQTALLPENTRNDPTTDESVRRSPEAHPELVDENLKDVKSCTDGSQSERHTYSLESVAQTIDDAKAAGIPVVDALKSVTTVTKPNTTRRTNLMRLNSKSDSELMEGNEKVSPDRYTHSLEDMSRTLEDAQKAGIPVIQALDQLTNELAEFSRTALGEDVQIAPLLKDNRKRKRYSETTIRELSKGTREQSPYPSPHASPYPHPYEKLIR
ncbi:hypothetical protein OS493_014485 [Desmophyllum pertusum]|uniref:Calponin-homology (CH) domain-containing protein n=1 Tax=Desmophyllum pertusum TaxID=174260 RepID=A0A9W9YPV5_9CNID|nr:hypothetical protein OS493_014485 [Desmophyllum pertusum]